MKVFLTFLISTLLISSTIIGQIEIKGSILEKETKHPVEFAEILLLTKQSSLVMGVITDINGEFELRAHAGEYTLQAVYLGTTLYTVNVIVADKPIDLGAIEIINNQELDEVVITGKKILIQRKIDRLVFNVENSSKSSEGDALEVLRITPGVRVQNDEITMIGKSNLQVMIDGKIVKLSNEDLSNFLKSIASEDIKSIEVISTPPAKYEAAGNSGLVNITLKQAKKDSWNAQVKSMYNQRKYPKGSFGGSFNFNKDKLSIATSLNYNNGIYYQDQDDYAYFPDGIWYTSSPLKSAFERVNGRIDINYQITPKWTMGGQYLYNITDYNITDAPYTPVFDYDTDEIIRSLQSDGTINMLPKIHSMNYNTEVELDTLGRRITLNLDYFSYINPDVKTYNGVSTRQTPFLQQFYKGTNTNIQDVTNLSAKLDIEYPLDWINLDFGGKLSISKSLNDILFFNSGLVNNPVTELPLSATDFDYKENIQALYISANKKINDIWSAKIGLRMEATQTYSASTALNLSRQTDINKFFPTVYISYDATENSNFSFNYSNRIERPSFFELNPNIYFSNPFQTIEGNAYLQPSFVDNFELTNTYKNFITTFYYSYEDNLFSQVPLPDINTNIIRFTNENYINTNRIGISENYTFDKVKWWNSSNSVNVNFSRSEFNLEREQANQEGLNASISTYNDFNLNSNKTIFLGVNYWYSFPGVNGIFATKSASSLSLSFQYLLLDRNLNITLRMNDIFKTSAERLTTTVNGVYQTARYYYDSRSFQLSASYKFGNKDIAAKKHKTGNNDEKGRTGN